MTNVNPQSSPIDRVKFRGLLLKRSSCETTFITKKDIRGINQSWLLVSRLYVISVVLIVFEVDVQILLEVVEPFSEDRI